MSNFSELKISKAQIDNLNNMGYQSMTDIQAQALPLALQGKDVIAQAKTGSGKTAAFSLAILDKINPRFFGAQALVLCPTRELATQVAQEIRKLARHIANIKVVILSGGQPIGPQIGSLSHGAHIVVGTPGRIKDHLRKNTLKIDQIKTLVLDEADRMLDMGFRDDIEDIAAHTPEQRQTLLFSATYPENIEQLSKHLQYQPESIRIADTHDQKKIQQQLFICPRSEKIETLKKVLSYFDIQQAVIFCNTKQVVQEVSQALQDLRCSAMALQGDMDQKDRDRVLIRFKQQSANFLIATDVAARGLDVDDLEYVINFDLPRDTDVYAHRIGRTGRADKSGIAISIATEKEQYKIEAINEHPAGDLHAEQDLTAEQATTITPMPYVSLCLQAGRKDKLRPGDILGALTNNGGIDGKTVGKIDVLDYVAYVAVERDQAKFALEHLQQSRIKGRKIKVRKA
ncbi:ATP-dependent RNA helicase DbpA [Bacterioplanoides sp.]|uniref:ATP-dependent RNA helicase DbpA n=1 Tax=Bacterioplanoides sp. TaxID=2066072 RepID=UPI003B5C432F